MSKRTFECADCGCVWRVTRGQPRPDICPECESGNIGPAHEQRGKGRDKRHSKKREWDSDQPWED